MQGEAPAANGATTRLAEANQADLHTHSIHVLVACNQRNQRNQFIHSLCGQ